jgi:hypothetical protein
MTTETIMIYGVILLAGAASIGIGFLRWRAGGKDLALQGTMLAAISVQALTVGWMRYVAWAVMALTGVIVGKRFFTARDPGTLWIGLFLLPFILGIALMALAIDDLSVMQKAAFAAMAVIVAAAIVTAIVRLWQASRARHA